MSPIYRIYVVDSHNVVRYWVGCTRKNIDTVAQSVYMSLRKGYSATAVRWVEKEGRCIILGWCKSSGVVPSDNAFCN